MTIKIVRNSDGNCITFEGSSNPVYFNACLSGEVDANFSDRINVINDIATAQSAETVYEFYQIDYTEFRDSENNPFATAADAAAYITAQGNVIAVAGATYLGTWDASTNTPTLVAATHVVTRVISTTSPPTEPPPWMASPPGSAVTRSSGTALPGRSCSQPA